MLLAGVLAGCSGSADEPGTPSATVSPTAPGDRPLVEVLSAGGEPRRVLALAPGPGATSSTATIRQQLATDQRPTEVPPVVLPVTTSVVAVDGDLSTVERVYGRPEVDGEGYPPDAVQQVRAGVAPLDGLVTTTVLRPDGTTEPGAGAPDPAEPTDPTDSDPTDPEDAAASVDTQLQRLVPVLPTAEVGVGATWTVTSVAEVDGAVVDEVATYSLDALDALDYTIGVSVRQTYRPGEVEGVGLTGGQGTVSARLTGSLTAAVATRASVDATAEVSYAIGDRITQVRTTVATELVPRQ